MVCRFRGPARILAKSPVAVGVRSRVHPRAVRPHPADDPRVRGALFGREARLGFGRLIGRRRGIEDGVAEPLVLTRDELGEERLVEDVRGVVQAQTDRGRRRR